MRKLHLILAFTLALTNPAAHAISKDTLKLLSAAVAGGGLGAMITTCGKGGNGCQMGALMAMLGGVGLLFGMKEDKPKEIRCYTDATGMRKVVMYGNSGQQTQFVQPAPGQPIVYPPTNMPAQHAQSLSGQLVQLCNQPQLISNVNTALVTPQPPPVQPPTQLQPDPGMNAGTPPAVILPQTVAADPWAVQAD